MISGTVCSGKSSDVQWGRDDNKNHKIEAACTIDIMISTVEMGIRLTPVRTLA